MALKWNNILRWIHLIAGMIISVYFFAIVQFDHEWEPWVTDMVGQLVIAIVFWTGIIKWQLPRIKKWNKNRKRKAEAAAAE